MKTIGVVGAGTMGAGIAQVAALSGFEVVMNDISAELLQQGMDRIAARLHEGAAKGKLSEAEANAALVRITTETSFEGFSGCELVIEAAIEHLGVKTEIFRKLESYCSPDTILASNTSSLSITSIASKLARPDRVAGMHFFNPVHIMQLVEVVRGHQTSEEVIAAAVDCVRKLGKAPVVVKDTPGFIVNRVARPFYGEALRLLGEGVASVEEIDRIVKLEGGFKMGPFELMDLIGIDVNLAVTRSMYEQTFGEPRYRPHVIQQNMVEAGLLGRKTKRGFYDHSK